LCDVIAKHCKKPVQLSVTSCRQNAETGNALDEKCALPLHLKESCCEMDLIQAWESAYLHALHGKQLLLRRFDLVLLQRWRFYFG